MEPCLINYRGRLNLMKRPLHLLRGFLNEFKPVEGENCKPKTRQLAEILQLILRCQATPKEYFDYRFYELDKDYSYMLNFLFHYELNKTFRPALNKPEWAFLFRNKLLFNQYYRQHNLPVTDLYGYYDTRAGLTFKGMPLSKPEQLQALLAEIKPPNLVIKPVGGDCGHDILIIEKINYQTPEWQFIESEDRILTFDEIVKHLAIDTKRNRYTGFILEEKVEQHAFTKALNPSSLNTFRIITLLDMDNEAEILLSSLRFGKEGVLIDNTATGGHYFCINPEKGIIAPGLSSYREGYKKESRHPVTGKRYEGLEIPYWEEIVRVCKEAARLAPFCRTIGWDVALTPGGPVLIEGNDDHAIITQGLFDGYLQPEVRKKLERFGLLYPEGNLPGIRVKRLFDALSGWSKSSR